MSDNVNDNKGLGDQCAVLFELETLAVNGRKIIYDVVANVLADKGIKMTRGLFSNKCLNSPARLFVPSLLKESKKKNVTEDGIADEIKRSVKLSLADGKVKLNPQFKLLLEMARGKGVKTAMLSCSDYDTAANLLEKFELMTDDTAIHPSSCDVKNFPSADAWLQLAKMISVHPARCVAVTTSSISCKSALSAGMRCVALPDSFTGFQDFGGASYVLDSLDEESANSIISLLERS